LLEIPAFRWPSKGLLADLPEDGYIFHLRTLAGFLGELKLRSDPQRPFPKGGIQIVNLDKIRERIDSISLKYRYPAWIPLQEIAEGTYCDGGLRSKKTRLMSWWTSSILEQNSIMTHLYRLGIPRDWLSEDCVLVRCSIDQDIRSQARVPSALDGFASEIFLPNDYARGPIAGRAIDIGSNPFQLGDVEVILGPVSVNFLEMRLIKIPKAADEGAIYSDDPAFLQKLVEYYRDACHE
jgi:hypothetical protein